MIERFIGFIALRKIKAQWALAVVSLAALLLVATTIVTSGHVALWAIVSCGLFNSVMWPCIFRLSVRGLGKFTSHGSGILITMVVVGAVIPLIQGFFADACGYRRRFAIVLICYAYILYFSLKGHRSISAG